MSWPTRAELEAMSVAELEELIAVIEAGCAAFAAEHGPGVLADLQLEPGEPPVLLLYPKPAGGGDA